MAVKSKEPNVEAPWPPYGGTQKPVGPADDWWKVQKAAGRLNVWDVIYFNFGTVDCDEVNWHMENYLGCNILSGNKKSYKFGHRIDKKTVEPVTIYMPPPGWTPPYGAKIPAPPVRPAMSVEDEETAAYVRSVLYSNALGFVNFSIGPLVVDYTHYRQVANWIKYGVISVYTQAPSADVAKYDPVTNALYVKNLRGIEDEAMIIHEATHAICDMKGLSNILTADDECAGYFAATIYAQKKVNTDRRLLYGAAEIYLEAFKLYQKYMAFEPLTYQSFADLRTTIGKHSEYKGKMEHAAGYDGIFYG